MKYVFFWIAIVGIGIGVALWAEAHQQGSTRKGSSIVQLITGGKAYAAEGTGNAASKFSSLCVTCHGATGKGDGPAAAALNPKPKDFTACKAMAKFSDETLFKTIKGGGQSTGLSPMMPAWNSQLTDPQIHNMVKYVRSFCKK